MTVGRAGTKRWWPLGACTPASPCCLSTAQAAVEPHLPPFVSWPRGGRRWGCKSRHESGHEAVPGPTNLHPHTGCPSKSYPMPSFPSRSGRVRCPRAAIGADLTLNFMPRRQPAPTRDATDKTANCLSGWRGRGGGNGRVVCAGHVPRGHGMGPVAVCMKGRGRGGGQGLEAGRGGTREAG